MTLVRCGLRAYDISGPQPRVVAKVYHGRWHWICDGEADAATPSQVQAIDAAPEYERALRPKRKHV